MFEIRGQALVVMVFRAAARQAAQGSAPPNAQVGMTEHCVDGGAAVAVRHREHLPGGA